MEEEKAAEDDAEEAEEDEAEEDATEDAADAAAKDVKVPEAPAATDTPEPKAVTAGGDE